MKKTNQKDRAAAGGKARSEALSQAQRKAIAENAAAERWARERGLPKETHTGTLNFGPGIECSVLSNGMRVLSLNGLNRAFGSNRKDHRADDDALPPVVSAANVQRFIPGELRTRLSSPIEFRRIRGGRNGLGYEAEVLAKICDVLLDARAAGVLRQSQLHIAAAAELMMRGFAHVGLVALIDEATGFQAERARDELHRILEQYISKELLPWTKKFPDEFFENVYRVHGWKYAAGNTQRPGYVGRFINRFVYEQLPDGVMAELRRKNPPVNGHRRHKHFQLLSDHTGNPHLDRQIVATTTIMKLAEDKEDFKAKFRKLFPKRGDQEEFEFDAADDAVSMEVGPAAATAGIVDLDEGPRGRALNHLRSGNTTGTRDLARHVYGADGEATMNKMRKLLSRLSDEDLVESPSPGLWRWRAHQAK
jgi:hypothetical protein